MPNILLDTGPFVALLESSEKNHRSCVSFFKDFNGQVFTTEPVLTEVLYLLAPSVKAQKLGIEFILKGGAVLVPQSLENLRRSLELMEQYKDTPMDFVDATLVTLAEEMGITEIVTLDAKGFHTYRIFEKKAFTIFPEQ